MRVLLIGVLLLELLHVGLPESFFNPFAIRGIPVVVRRPYEVRDPLVYTPYGQFQVNPGHPRGRPQIYSVFGGEGPKPFDRGHIEAHPHTFRQAEYFDNERVPLRDSVEKIPIEAQMNIIRKNSIEQEEAGPFSRGDVEALPAPDITSYPDTQALPYRVRDYTDLALVGFREDVESPPRTPNINPFVAFYPDLNQRFSSSNPYRPAIHRPLDYRVWNSPINFLKMDEGKKVVCYYESWSVYRDAPSNFDIDDIDPFACSHLIYSFAGLDNKTFEIISLDHERDIIKGAYKSVVTLKQKNPALKVMIAVGGWAEGGKKYSDMVSSAATRNAFVNSIINFMKENMFDGLDLDWEYPGSSDRGGRSTDKENISLLIEQLREVFKQRGWILSMAVPPAKARIDEGYDLKRLSNSLDFFNLMVYDLRGPWDGVADHHAPFYSKESDKYLQKGLNLVDGVQLFVDYGVPKEKIIVGLPFYGRSFTLLNPKENTPGSRIKGPGKSGRYTQEKGYIAYYEICTSQRNGGWKVHNDSIGNRYMVKDDQWIGYDDEKAIELKVNFIKHEDFGGAMVWAIDLDDTLGLCGKRWPLLSAIRRILYSPKIPGYEPSITPAPAESPFPNSEIAGSPMEKDKISTSGTTGPSVVQRINFNCSMPGYYRTRAPCRLYFICDEENKAFQFECPEGMAFDIRRRLCRWQSQVICGEAYSPLIHTRTVICGEDGIFSHPLNCTKYVWCKAREAIELDCPRDLYFDSRRGRCTQRNEAFCILGEMTEAPGGSYRYTGLITKSADGPKVMCYFTNWAYHRPGKGKFVPEHIDPELCTHVVYCFAVLDSSDLVIRSSDSRIDLEHGFYERTLKLKEKNPALKVLLSVGGWTDSVGDKYSRLVNNPEARYRFVQYATDLLIAYGFDGLEMHWEHPVCLHMDCSVGPLTDKQGYAALIRELHQAFLNTPSYLELAVAVSPARAIIHKGYDIRTISANADYINVMTYDYHGFWEKKTGHVSPLYFREGDKHESQNTDFSINFIIQAGGNPSKMLVGVPFYSQTFTLANPGQTTLNSKASGPGNAGPITFQKGMLSYQETCQQIRKPGWIKAVDNKKATGPYAYKGDQWLSFDDAESVTRKGRYILEMKLGGGMVWTVDFDDFANDCCKEPFPLLRALNRALSRTVPYPRPQPGGNCAKPPAPVTPPPPTPTTTYQDGHPKKPSTKPGDLLTTEKSTPKWQGTKPPFTTTTSRKTVWWLSSTTPRSTTTITTTTALPTTTTTTTPRTTWWWTPSKTSKSTILGWQPSSTTTRTTTSSTTTTAPLTTTTTLSTPQIWWWTTPTSSKMTTHKTTTPRTTQTSTWWWTPPSTTSTTKRPLWPWAPSTTAPTTKRPYEISSTGQPYPGKTCHHPRQYEPDPRECSKFLKCKNGKLVEATCIPGLHWNKKKQICDWPANAGCKPSAGPTTRPPLSHTTRFTSTNRPPTTPDIFWWTTKPSTRFTTTRPTYSWTSTTPRRPTETLPERCRGSEKRPTKKCAEYYECVGGTWHKRNCAPGLHWSKKKKICDWPAYAECAFGVRQPVKTTTPPSVDEQPPPTGPMPGDKCSGSQMIPKPGSCSAFLTCNQGVFIESFCAPGLHWNEQKRNCDWPENSKCKKKVGQPPISTPEVIHPPVDIAPPGTFPLDPAPAPGLLSGDFMVVCYFTNWSRYRPGRGKFLPEDIDSSKCTHIVYGFAVLDYSNLVIKPHDSWADIDLKSYEHVTRLKSRGVKVTIAIGGWNDSAGDKYSRLLNSPAARAKFIDHVISFIETHNFDGLDLDYEYPACPQVDCKKGNPSDKPAFAAFIKELSMAFKPRGLLLSAAVSPSKTVIDAGYDVPALNKYLDWIAVMTYDFHGHWDKKTGHVAPMYHHPDDDNDYFNMDFAIRYWIRKGAEPKNIVLGMPLYGQAFTLNNPNVNGLNAPANQKGTAGRFTRAAGFLAYYEICAHINEGWTVVQDPKGRMGPYAYRGNQWVGFDDVETIRKKSQYIRDMKLGGGMVWALDLDDFSNQCGQGKYPLMSTIHSVLGPGMDGGQQTVTTRTPPPPPTPPGTEAKPDDGTDLKVVCYFTNWSTYRPGEGKYGPTNIRSELCTHVNYGFVVLDEATLTLKPHDKWIDIDNNFFEHVIALKEKNKNLKVLAALGGWNDSKGSKYSDLVRDPQARKRFNEHALSFLMHYKFDGMDLDWEYPGCPQMGCKKGSASDKANFAAWIKELKMLFEPHGLLLTAAVSPNFRVIDKGYDVPALSQYLDFINVMTYDYHGQWDKVTGHFSPLYVHPETSEKRFNADYTIKYWIQNGADPKKLIMGMGMYGQSFTLAQSYRNGLNQPAIGGGEAGPYTRAKGFLAYYEICYFIRHHGWTVVRDPLNTMGPYAYKGNQWVGFDDIPMIETKSEYIRKMGLGGGMIWALDLDDYMNRCSCEEHPLLRAINRVLRPSLRLADPKCALLEEGTKIGPTTSYPPTTRPSKSTTPSYFPDPATPSIPTYPEPPSQPVSTGVEGAPCQAGEFRPHAQCNKFYECYKGKLREVSCYSSFHWDGKGRCVEPSKARCKPGTPVHPPQPLPPRVVTIPPRRVVDAEYGAEGQVCQAGEFKRHPSMCDKFYECLHGTLRERQCFPGLHWDGKGRCTWPNQAKCKLAAKDHQQLTTSERPDTTTSSYTRPTTRYTSYTPPTQWYTTTTTRKPETTSNKWYVPWTPSTKPTTPKPTHPPGPLKTIGKKVICYFTNWAWYRRGIGKYRPEDIDTDLCTHILYGFAVLDSNKYIIKPHDSWADIDNEFYQKVTGLKAKGKIVLVALGGWNDSKGPKYSKLVNDPAKRARFIAHVLEFIEKYNFDGLDLDWEYPKCWQVDCKKGPDSDKDAFSAWMRELSAALKPRNLLLSAAISPSKTVIDHAYHVPDLMRYLDFVNVMTYDYHGHWDKQTGHVAPLYYHDETINEFFNANYTIHFLLERGAQREKLMMGMPLYGQAFTLKNPSKPTWNSPASKGQAGPFTRAAGFLAYYEICNKIKNEGYTVKRDPLNRIGPYAYKGNQFVGFDDATMIEIKSNYIMEMNLGGGMIWALDLDDFNNYCGCEPHPLLRTINRVLRNYPKPPPAASCGF